MNATVIHYKKYLDVEDFLEDNRQILADYICGLCNGVYDKPVVDLFGKIYCKKCITLCVNKTGKTPDGHPLPNVSNLIGLSIISKILGRQKLNCINRKSHCDWIGELSNLDEHLENDCVLKLEECANENCVQMINKFEMEAHLNTCEFKKQKCENCEISLTSALMEKHADECSKAKISCPNECGENFERSLVKNHVMKFCPNESIECPYVKIGCNYKVERKEMVEHIKDHSDKHNLLIFEDLNSIHGLIDEVKETYDKKIESVYKILKSKGFETHETREKKFIARKKSKEKNEEVDLEVEYKPTLFAVEKKKKRKIDQKEEKKELISRKRQRQESDECYLEDIDEYLNKPSVKNLINNSDNVTDLAQKSEPEEKINAISVNNILSETDAAAKNNHMMAKATRSGHPSNYNNVSTESTPISGKTLYREEITLDTLDISKGVSVNLNVAVCNNTTKNEHKFAMANNVCNDTNCEWKVTINELSGWLGIGVCLKELVASNKFKFSSSRTTFLHGTFMVSTNGYSWNTNNEEENNKYVDGFPKLKAGDEVKFKFEYDKEELTIKVGSFSFVMTDVCYPKGNALVPCVVFLMPGDKVTFGNMTRF